MIEAPRIDPHPLRGWRLVLLCAVYLVAGLAGHDPWKNDDAINFGIAYGFLSGGSWLVPHLAGEAWLDSPPLFHWVAALLGAATDGLLPLHDGIRLAGGLFGALFLFALSRAGRALHGADAGPATVLIAVGSLGLLVPLHETQPAAALLAATALAWWGLLRLPDAGAKAGLLLGGGIGIGFLAAGLDAFVALLPITLLTMLAPRWRRPEARRGLLVALLTAAPLVAIWPLLLAWQAPEALTIWWSRELASLQPTGASPISRHLELLSWAAWPAWPLALWALWRHRRRLAEARLALPLVGSLIAAGMLVTLHEARGLYALPLMTPITLLAAAGAGDLRRGAASAFDWFCMMTFTLIAALVWLGAIAMVFGVPAQIAHNAVKLAPGFVGHLSPGPWAAAALLTVLWLLRIRRAPRSPFRAVVHCAAGVALMWALLAALWFPWIDYGKSYRGVALELKQAAGDDGCIIGQDLGDALRASLQYFVGMVTVRAGQPGAGACRLLLAQGTAQREDEARPGWQLVWEGHRPSDRDERLRLYRRAAAR